MIGLKKVNLIILLFVSFIFCIDVAKANDIKKITMDIFVDSNGDAHVTEEWVADLSSGTEGYKPYYNLGTSEIINFKVSLNDKVYTTLDYWNVDASFSEKSYQAGINSVDNGYELCFGISKYGLNTYKMEYTITNFVVGTDDADMIYWQLIPYDLSDKPDYVAIKIHSDFEYDMDIPVWGYGNYGGYAYVDEEDGAIYLIEEDGLGSDEYMTVLVKFPKGTFMTRTELGKDFNAYYEMAEDGATTYEKDKISFFNIIIIIITNVLMFIFPIIIFVMAFRNYTPYGTKKLKFGKGEKKVNDAPYFRDIPCNKDIFKAYWVACQYRLVKNNTDFLGTILLKWLKNGNVQNVEVPNAKNNDKALKLVKADGLTEIEIELWNMMVIAARDGVLESYEFTNWCKSNYNKILKWFNKAIDGVTMSYVVEGKIIEQKKTFSNLYVVHSSMQENGRQMAGLKKFLNEFSNIKEREAIEVQLWEEYLMYAQIFGIAKKVAKEFKKLYPDVVTEEYYNDIIFIHTISYQGVSAASSAKQKAESYSSGGGGFSSGGGGGGSFGGGGGGGGFR